MRTNTIALTFCFGVALFLVGCGTGPSEDDASGYPEQPIELIVPYGAGGATDAIARSFAEEAESELDQPVNVVNRPGGGAAIGATEAANAEPDGHTIFLAAGGPLVNTPLLQDVEYSIDDFEGIIGLADQPYVLVAGADSQWQTLDDLASADERIEYAITGRGNNTHITQANFFQEAGVPAEAIPFDAATDGVQAVAGGQTEVAAVDMNIGAPQVEAGEVRALAITAQERLDFLPDTPTLEEEGYPESTTYSRVALAAPAETPDERIEVLREAASEVVESSEFQEFRENNYLLSPEVEDGERWLNELIRSEEEQAREDLERLDIEEAN